jgi:hypothetical protein
MLGCKRPMRQVARETKFHTVVTNTSGSFQCRACFHVTFLAPRIIRLLLDFSACFSTPELMYKASIVSLIFKTLVFVKLLVSIMPPKIFQS